MAKSLQDLKDELSIAASGMTVTEAWQKGICIECRKPPRFKTPAGEREYRISGLCEYCWDEIMADEDDAF